MQKVFDLYNGPFLAKETEMSWILGPRERLRLKLLQAIKRLDRRRIFMYEFRESTSYYTLK